MFVFVGFLVKEIFLCANATVKLLKEKMW